MEKYIYIAIVAFIVSMVFYAITRRIKRNAHRKALMAQPIPNSFLPIIEKNVKLYNHLPEKLKTRLHGLINVFLAEKTFEGCAELEITDEIRATIAAQACMLLLNQPHRFYPKLQTILVYPSAYVNNQLSGNGPQGGTVVLGESWQNGPVVLSWDNVLGGTTNINDAQNVVIHEFAHQLDQEDGSGDGAPILETRNQYATWGAILGSEYKNLQQKIFKRRKTVLRRYGGTNPAEFFAVATETFFEKPKKMNKYHPELYTELKKYYKLDPLEW